MKSFKPSEAPEAEAAVGAEEGEGECVEVRGAGAEALREEHEERPDLPPTQELVAFVSFLLLLTRSYLLLHLSTYLPTYVCACVYLWHSSLAQRPKYQSFWCHLLIT